MFDSWKTSSLATAKFNDADKQVAKQVHSCWVAFAKAPVTTKSLDCAGLTWPGYTKENDSIAVFNTTSAVKKAAALPKFVPPPST